MSVAAELSPVMAIAAKAWYESYKNHPVITLVTTFIIMGAFIAGINYANEQDKAKREITRLKNLEYETQITQLKDTEKNIKKLLSFIEHQKSSLRETQDTIKTLQDQQKKLKPLVESDQAVVEAIFKAQEERQRSNVWRERWIGFAFGLIASLIASFFWFLIRLGITRRSS